MRLARRIGVAALVAATIYLGIALGMILSQWPSGEIGTEGGLDFDRQISAAAPVAAPVRTYRARDGRALSYRAAPAPTKAKPLLVLLHGSGWHSAQFTRLATGLSPVADVVAPDLRGHGFAPARRGDIDHIGQLEEDIADLIAATRRPGQKVILAGHSSGGGLVVRFAGGKYGDLIDGAVLMAPFLKYNAPTTRPNSGGWAQPLTRRIIGLSMLNSVGIHALDSLVVIRFVFPKSVRDGPLGHTITDAYSWRLNTSFAPRGDYLSDIAALPEFLLIAGGDDEAFFAGKYEPLMRGVTGKGTYRLVAGVSHLDIVDARETLAMIRSFAESFAAVAE